ncbi:MAG: 50S ribosomal protein L11 methyltransferase [Ignavibacteria bacterium]|jgi:ribosomal protein L11 methyltransferase
MKDYIQYTIKAVPFNAEILSSYLWQLEIEGLIENNTDIIVYSSKKLKYEIENEFKKIICEGFIEHFDVTEKAVENKNWNEEWEKKINVVEVTDKIIVKPSFKDYESNPNQIIITIDPKMSFGTGDHPTTRMALKLLEKYISNEKRIIDVGTGTGILSIASAKLGAENILGIDNDEWCLINATENVRKNYVEDKVEIRKAELHEVNESDFDFVIANINKNVLQEICDTINDKIFCNGKLILTGLLIEDEKDILKSYSFPGLNLKTKLNEDEWIALYFEKEIMR